METDTQPTLPTVNEHPLDVTFRRLWFPDYSCGLEEVSTFRKRVNAMLRAAGQDEPLFHNHGEGKKYTYGFPGIQYRSLPGKQGAEAGIWGLGEAGARAISVFEDALFAPCAAQKAGLDSCFNYSAETRTASVGLTDSPRTYLLRDFALNRQQAERWQQNPSRRNQDDILQKDLLFRIFGFLNAVGYHVPDQLLRIGILDIPEGTWMQSPPSFHGDKGKGRILTMDVEFAANIDLPDFVGLGIHKAYGWGVLQRIP